MTQMHNKFPDEAKKNRPKAPPAPPRQEVRIERTITAISTSIEASENFKHYCPLYPDTNGLGIDSFDHPVAWQIYGKHWKETVLATNMEKVLHRFRNVIERSDEAITCRRAPELDEFVPKEKTIK